MITTQTRSTQRQVILIKAQSDLKKREVVLTRAHHDFEKGLNLHAFFKTHNRTTGEDMVQETFMKTWSYLLKGGKIDSMKAFLYHVLNHLVVDEYRKHKTTSLDALLEKGYEPSTGDAGNHFNVMDGKEALLLIQCLPEKYQKVMRMRYLQELTLKEMSLISGQSRNTMAVQMAVQAHRGLDKLKLLYNSA